MEIISSSIKPSVIGHSWRLEHSWRLKNVMKRLVVSMKLLVVSMKLLVVRGTLSNIGGDCSISRYTSELYFIIYRRDLQLLALIAFQFDRSSS